MNQCKTIDPELTYKRAAEVLRHEPDTGTLVWRVNRGPNKCAGAEAGWVGKRGRRHYRIVGVDGKCYLAHRLAWLLHHGEWPNDGIDHIDGDGLNNKIDNLRDVNQAENLRNSRMRSNNSSGVNGVYWHKRDKKWLVRIKINDKNKHLGYFDDLEEAAAARAAANIKYGFSERHGIRTY